MKSLAAAGYLPRILVIDDMLGRVLRDEPHFDRSVFLKRFRMRDLSGDGSRLPDGFKVSNPFADVVFCRGQTPQLAGLGDLVENDLEGTLEVIRKGWNHRKPGKSPWALVVLDMCFYTGQITSESEESDSRGPGMPEGREADSTPQGYFGLKILRAIRENFGPELPVVVLSSMDSRRIEADWVEGGVTRFIPRDGSDAPEQMREALWRAGLFPDPSGEIVGSSLPLLRALRTSRNLGPSEHVLLRGESGVGKELLARYINRSASSEGKRPFVTINTPGIATELLSSELFGHEKGAFTDAKERRLGKFELADGGDIFFDEIGYAVEAFQANLLRVLQEGRFQRVGGSQDLSVKVRFLAATDANVEERLVAPLRNRIAREITLPPLRERREDIPALVDHLLEILKKEGVFSLQKRVDPTALEQLCAYDWPGNIRELERVLREACGGLYAEVPRLAVVHLPESLQKTNSPEPVPDSESLKISSGPFLDLPGALSESLPGLQKAVVEYLVRVLEETREPVSGKLVPTQAFKLILPESERGVDKSRVNLTNRGAGFFKKLLSLHPPTIDHLLPENETLKEVWPWVISRGGSTRKNSTTAKNDSGKKSG